MEQFYLSHMFDLIEEIVRVASYLKVSYCRYKNQQQEAVIFTLYNQRADIVDVISAIDYYQRHSFIKMSAIIRLLNKVHIVYDLPERSVFLLYFLHSSDNVCSESFVWGWLPTIAQLAYTLSLNGIVFKNVDLRFFLVDTDTHDLQFIGVPLLQKVDSDDCFGQQIASIVSTILDLGTRMRQLSKLQYCATQEQPEEIYLANARPNKFFPLPLVCFADVFADYIESASNVMNYLLTMLTRHGLRAQELIEHPLFITKIENQRSILYSKYFSLKEFLILKDLGQGAFGAVQYAIHVYSQQRVALKYSKRIQVQQKEANFLKSLIHPCVVRFYGEFVNQENYYIIMQYCEGGSLFTVIKDKTYEIDYAIVWMAYLASALYYLHDKSIIHRDMKPYNILLSNNYALIADFGISKQTDGDTRTQTGTKYYISPQIYNNEQYDNKTDVFSLGLVFYNLVSKGKHPFAMSDVEAQKFYMQQSEALLTHQMNKITRYFRELIFNMLRIRAEDRFTMAQVCTSEPLYSVIYKLGLPYPRYPGERPSVLELAIAQDNYYLDVNALFALNFDAFLCIQALFRRNMDQLGYFFVPLLLLSKRFIINRLGFYQTQYSLALAGAIQRYVLDSMQQDAGQPILADGTVSEMPSTISYISEDLALQIQPVLLDFVCRRAHYAFAYAIELRDDIVFENGTVVVVHKIDCHKERINIKLKEGAILAFQVIDNGRIKFSGAGALFTDAQVEYAVRPFAELYGYSILLDIIGEYANISCPDIFKAKYGYTGGNKYWE